MLKLLKYLKKSIFPILLIIGLLVVQAACDLTLPQYTSDIVNVGIQQGGVEDAVPEVIRAGEMEKLFLFMTQAQQDEVLASYKKIEKSALADEEYADYVKKYPLLAEQALYVRLDVDEDTRTALNTLFGMPMLMVAGFEGDNEQMQAVADQMLASLRLSWRRTAWAFSTFWVCFPRNSGRP